MKEIYHILKSPSFPAFCLFMVVTTVSFSSIGDEQLLKDKDQMVCHIGKILPVLNKNHSNRSMTCLRKSTQTSHNYNNLADVYAEGWSVTDINNANIWILAK